jgi:CheY-like chemotaxis protein
MSYAKSILLVENDSVDAMTVKRALKDLKVINPVVHVNNGREALEYLKNKDNKQPCVVLLDLDMPETNGVEFLKVAKADERLKLVPVIILTVSSEERDIIQTFKLGVGGYIIKPIDYWKFVEAVRTLAMYWTLSELPDEQ